MKHNLQLKIISCDVRNKCLFVCYPPIFCLTPANVIYGIAVKGNPFNYSSVENGFPFGNTM